jgi:tetratricopeptide (TPR) repeat protein
MKKEYENKIRKKTLSIKNPQSQIVERMGYSQAMSLITACRNNGRYQEEESLLEQICTQISNIPEPGLYLLGLYLNSINIQNALPLVEQLLKKFPRESAVLRQAARFHQLTNNIDQAIALIEKAIALQSSNAENHHILGLLLRSIGKSDQALTAINTSLKLKPSNCEAILVKAKTLKESASDSFVAETEQLLRTSHLTDSESASLHYALSWMFEASDMDSHFSHLNEANQLMARTRPYDAKTHRAKVNIDIEKFTKTNVSKLTGKSTDSFSPIFVAAMPRSGTTLLEQMLGAHSQIRGIGESRAFRLALEEAAMGGNSLANPNLSYKLEKLPLHLADIASKFKNNYFVRNVGNYRPVDKSIENYADIGLILSVFPKACIIDLQRHPLDIIYSCYRQNFTSGHNYSFNLEDLANYYLLYRRQVEHWLTLFPNQIISISYENLVQSTEEELKKLLSFCDIEWENACVNFQKKNALVKTASDEQVRKPVHQQSVDGWKRVEKFLEPASTILAAENFNYEPI